MPKTRLWNAGRPFKTSCRLMLPVHEDLGGTGVGIARDRKVHDGKLAWSHRIVFTGITAKIRTESVSYRVESSTN